MTVGAESLHGALLVALRGLGGPPVSLSSPAAIWPLGLMGRWCVVLKSGAPKRDRHGTLIGAPQKGVGLLAQPVDVDILNVIANHADHIQRVYVLNVWVDVVTYLSESIARCVTHQPDLSSIGWCRFVARKRELSRRIWDSV